ncbi:PEPxxWA-CTERM sorting domain-containing protein [Polymorphobacter fuscus]|uniref:PEPxxWA-CTERM sorting domain-containing protein n=1 Tax=Sandarakinorhabdus fusca TaxID=1439888 RepID=UPI0016A63726|nr:PEPxxWA-CTERM sorting domain-containing protein [Polymorphobacter fuscus]NJC07351.1 hypothetical protein [Polymorphobacter fuscus]
MIAGLARLVLVVAALSGSGGPAQAIQTAIGSQILEDFEGRQLGATSINFCDVAYPALDCLGTLSGGSVTLATAAFPANSPTQVYIGSIITLDIVDNFDYSWPAVAAYVSGSAPIRFRAWEYDANLGGDRLVADFSTNGSDSNRLIAFGSDSDLQFLTLIEFSSSTTFAIDDFRIGLPDVAPGIPEPASWAMLIAGFGLTGASLRRRRATGWRTATPTG